MRTFVRAATNTCLASMKSSSLWLKDPTKYNHLLAALLITADNLHTGRPSSEDPENSAAWGTIETATILLGFTLLDEVAARRGDDFFNSPDGAADALQRIVLHFKALNILATDPTPTKRWLEERAASYRQTDPDYANALTVAVDNRTDREQQASTEFAYAPMWPLDPVVLAKDPEPRILMDGFCGHRTKYSTCDYCRVEWLRQYKESLEKRRAWERRQEEDRERSGRAQSEAKKLLNERRAELYGVRDCQVVHVRSYKKGDLCVTADGLKVWTYCGEPGSDPQLPFNWALTPSPLKNGFKNQREIEEWNEKTGRRDVLGRQIVEP